MELTSLGRGVHVLRGAVNGGLVETEAGLVAIDTGLDRGAGNRVLRAAEALGRPLCAIINTHAHADHHGGNAQILRRVSVPVYAPAAEAAVIREPRYEPLYLFGAEPVAALRSKFLLAEPSPVDHALEPGATVEIGGRTFAFPAFPGHALGQVGVRVDPDGPAPVLFAADAFFGAEALEKHGVPYLVDAASMRASLDAVAATPAARYVPGHGEPLDDPRATLAANARVLDDASGWLATRIAAAPASTEDLLPDFAAAFGLRLTDAGSFVLNRGALLGFLGALERAGTIRVVLEGGRWIWAGG